MKNVKNFSSKPQFVLTDIDDTLTDEGQLHVDAFGALWDLKNAGYKIIPVTGRPAGWCEMIARFWPVDAVVGENGGFYFRYHKKKMKRVFFEDEKTRAKNQLRLKKIEAEVLRSVPGAAVSSDQFCRIMDLAIDFCEDVKPLSPAKVKKIVAIFEKHGAQAKVSSIHVNGWFGDYNKVIMLKRLLKKEFGLSLDEIQKQCVFCGDSPNDEPMFEFFEQSVGVANIQKFLKDLQHPPRFVTSKKGGAGFVELAKRLLK